ncbi:hypothetical protein B0J11DRAFT_536442 [Dendryphion nanum]|uniref:Uncharacterized protein n=1 Tax=Dendryphion nanum TaxID=256645 RepID=A0A9P9IEC8_9PLEO|nr:hypothetical protein B0J11DRAFT_536442 [Dendryphion nanum]
MLLLCQRQARLKAKVVALPAVLVMTRSLPDRAALKTKALRLFHGRRLLRSICHCLSCCPHKLDCTPPTLPHFASLHPPHSFVRPLAVNLLFCSRAHALCYSLSNKAARLVHSVRLGRTLSL